MVASRRQAATAFSIEKVRSEQRCEGREKVAQGISGESPGPQSKAPAPGVFGEQLRVGMGAGEERGRRSEGGTVVWGLMATEQPLAFNLVTGPDIAESN